MLKRHKISLGVMIGVAFLFGTWFRIGKQTSIDFFGTSMKQVYFVDDGFEMRYANVAEQTVKDFVQQRRIALQQEDDIYPSLETPLVSGMRIRIVRAREMRVKADGQEKTYFTQATSIESALLGANIPLDEDDIVKPDRSMAVSNHVLVSVTRVESKEETKETKIAFETKVNEDATLSWRKKITTQKGENGIKTITYRVAYYDGKEVNRRVMKTEVTKEPVTEVVTQGTFVQVGKSHRGGASWYAFTGTMAAANPWLPMGSYVKVTNLDNGKSVVVKINDRGPFAPGRIIDLDKVAFAKIASLGAGVVTVKMEEVTN